MPVKSTILILTLSVASHLVLAQGVTTALPAQLLGSDDLVSLVVANSPELSHQFRIAPDGMLRLPFVATPIQARGRLPQQVEDDIREALKAQHFFVNPVVSLSVVEYASRPITVMGAVRRPITFQASGQTTLLDALARADGLAPEAGSTILVTRLKDSGTDSDVTTVPVRLLLGQADIIGNVRLYGGELIRVPEASRVYVLGNVKHPCFIPIKDPAETTILKVLAQAEGLLPFSSGEAVVYRRLEDGRKEIVINIKSILKGKAPDARLEPYDVLYVPEAKGRRLTADILDKLAGFGSSTASGFLVFKR